MNEFLHNNDFEQFLKKKAGQHRMYPDDKVWRAISKKIHGDTQWPGLSAITFVVVAALIAGTLIIKPKPDILKSNYHFALQSPGINNKAQVKDKMSEQNGLIAKENFSADKLTTQTILAVSKVISTTENIYQAAGNGALVENLSNITAAAPVNNPVDEPSRIAATSNENQGTGISNKSSEISALAYNSLQFRFRDPFDKLPRNKKLTLANHWPEYSSTENHHVEIPAINNIPEPIQQTALRKLKKQSSRFDFRFYITPSVSYRAIHHKGGEIQEDSVKQLSALSAPIESNYNIDPSQAINQRPAIGYETGFGLGYKLSKRVAVTGGFQFNISQYNVDAYLYQNEEPASVTLEEDGFTSTYTSYSKLRSIAGNNAVTFKTRYYQVSMPVGVDVTAIHAGKLSLGVAATLQPTYTFDKLPLIISSNFKNYTDGSRFIRNWNFNTGVETYIGYTSGSYRWQIGTHFRYQWLPSLDNKYPNKENIFNYGLKLGLVKYLRQ